MFARLPAAKRAAPAPGIVKLYQHLHAGYAQMRMSLVDLDCPLSLPSHGPRVGESKLKDIHKKGNSWGRGGGEMCVHVHFHKKGDSWRGKTRRDWEGGGGDCASTCMTLAAFLNANPKLASSGWGAGLHLPEEMCEGQPRQLESATPSDLCIWKPTAACTTANQGVKLIAEMLKLQRSSPWSWTFGRVHHEG